MFSQRDQVVEQLSAQSPADFELNSHPAATDVADIGGVSARIFRGIINSVEPSVVDDAGCVVAERYPFLRGKRRLLYTAGSLGKVPYLSLWER
jgi:hypothetical protein